MRYEESARDYHRHSIRNVDYDELFAVYAEIANWISIQKKGPVNVSPRADVVKFGLVRPPASLPVLETVSLSPIVGAEGHIISSAGYCSTNRTLLQLDPNLRIPPVPDIPTRDDADEEGAQLREFCAAWREEFGEQWVKATQLLALADERDLLVDLLRAHKESGRRSLLGKKLSQVRDRVFDDARLELKQDRHTKSTRYRLVRIKNESPRNETDENQKGSSDLRVIAGDLAKRPRRVPYRRKLLEPTPSTTELSIPHPQPPASPAVAANPPSQQPVTTVEPEVDGRRRPVRKPVRRPFKRADAAVPKQDVITKAELITREVKRLKSQK